MGLSVKLISARARGLLSKIKYLSSGRVGNTIPCLLSGVHNPRAGTEIFYVGWEQHRELSPSPSVSKS